MEAIMKLSYLALPVVVGAAACSSSSSSKPAIDAAVPSDEIVIVTGEGPPLAADEYTQIPVTLERGFVCLDEGVGSEMVLAEVAGLEGEQVVIVSQGDCQYDLLYRSTGGDKILSSAPGGYILAEATHLLATTTTTVCASNAHHVANGDERLVETVSIQCWARGSDGEFAALPDAVPPSGDYAAWVDSLVPDEANEGQFVLTWLHDFSFQFLNVSDEGRPETDGTYTTQLSFDGSALTAVATAQLSPSVLGEAPEVSEWIPTDEERQLAGGIFDIDDGECANGCLP